MVAPRGITKPDHLYPVFRKENSVLAPIACNLGTLGSKELWCGLGTTGGKKKQDEHDTHARRLPQRR